MAEEPPAVTFGMTVQDSDGNELGQISGFEEGGFYVNLRDGLEGLSIEHVTSGHTIGEGELLWRCRSCGAIGPIEENFPASCPDCHAPREELYYHIED